MSIRLKFAALFFTIFQLFLIQTISAESPDTEQSVSTLVTQKTLTQGDAIQQFVRGDFTSRRAMLNQWPASIEQLDQLVAYVEKDQLYTDSSGNTYLMRGINYSVIPMRKQ